MKCKATPWVCVYKSNYDIMIARKWQMSKKTMPLPPTYPYRMMAISSGQEEYWEIGSSVRHLNQCRWSKLLEAHSICEGEIPLGTTHHIPCPDFQANPLNKKGWKVIEKGVGKAALPVSAETVESDSRGSESEGQDWPENWCWMEGRTYTVSKIHNSFSGHQAQACLRVD